MLDPLEEEEASRRWLMRMEMTQEESFLLRNALEHYLRELTGEIGNTDNREFRSELKH